jgi:hypothetical protein
LVAAVQVDRGVAERAELERRLGHANDRYLRLYTNPPDDIAAGYVEDLCSPPCPSPQLQDLQASTSSPSRRPRLRRPRTE